ncbi:MAG: hemolysin family protein [Desulfarculaceae bacterium]
MDTEPRRSLITKLRRLLGYTRNTTPQELEREIQGLVDEGEAQGLLTPREGEMIEAVLELDQSTASQIMVPRTELAMVPSTATVEEVIQVIVDSGHSRIPVFSTNPDQIVGVIHAKDLLPHWGKTGADLDISKSLRPPLFVPLAMPLDELLTIFKRKRVHLAVVVDEYGGTAGVVTIEDVLEEIVGDIEDEYDQEEQLLRDRGDGSLLVDARLEVEDLAAHLEIELPQDLPEGRFETVGGFITTLLGRVPKPQEEVVFGPVRMVVVAADDRKVTQVEVHRNPEPAAPAGD